MYIENLLQFTQLLKVSEMEIVTLGNVQVLCVLTLSEHMSLLLVRLWARITILYQACI